MEKVLNYDEIYKVDYLFHLMAVLHLGYKKEIRI